MAFDPYYKWLGIPPKDQPPDHYRLLGIDLFECDPDVIADAAMQRMAHVRTYQLGQHQELSQKILNELATAKARLLDPEEKTEYDAGLRKRLAETEPPAERPVPSKAERHASQAKLQSATPITLDDFIHSVTDCGLMEVDEVRSFVDALSPP